MTITNGLTIDRVYRKFCSSDLYENFMDLFNQSEYTTEYWIDYDYIQELKIEYMFEPNELELFKQNLIDYIALSLDY